MFVKDVVGLPRPFQGPPVGLQRTTSGPLKSHLENSMVDLHVRVQKLLYFGALINVCEVRDLGEDHRKSRGKSFVVPEFKEARQVKTTVSEEFHRQLEAEAKRKEITMSEVVRQLIYKQHEEKQRSQSATR